MRRVVNTSWRPKWANTGLNGEVRYSMQSLPSGQTGTGRALPAYGTAMPSSSVRQVPARRRSMGHSKYDPGFKDRTPWNAGRKVGAKRAVKPQQVWAIRFWLDRERRLRDRAMFDLA